MQRAARFLFIACACLSFVMAVLPSPPQLPLQPSDKILHMLAFATLGGLAAYGFYTTGIVRLFAALTAFGALIELVQAIPVLHRDSDIMDLFADMGAALVALLAVRFIATRRERQS